MSNVIVTRQSLINLLNHPSKDFRKQVVGRALLVLFDRQTNDEKSSNVTSHHNGRGFAHCDAYSGTLSAKTFLKSGTLLDWQLQMWIKPNRHGVPRIAKYVNQLDEAARIKADAVATLTN